jgi:hypothetical protein
MPGLFDNLSDINSSDIYYDSDNESLLYDYLSSNNKIPLDNEDKDLFGGPDLEDPEPPSVPLLTPTPTISLASSPASSSTSLPLLIRPPISHISSALTIQTFEALTLTKSLASPKPQGYKQHSIGARGAALALLDIGVTFAAILKQTGVSESTCNKLKRKARDRG